ncbi:MULTISPECIES: hypothetical protein [unclassified Aeromicrobium]|uniref:hypothetical protein n=1 Tax=unclassified Aeromicrobium TaxID=2633570 RepID=UPI00288B202C|nr:MULTISPECIES: hypothetical protein [unclassified Aeromicrobium]
MATAGARVVGLRETIRALERYGVEAQDLKDVMERIGTNVVRVAHGRVRVKSGALDNSIRASKTKNKAVVRAGGARVRYAGVQNYGWPAHGIAGDLFLNKAADDTLAETIALMEEGLRDLARKYNFTTL